MDINGRSVWHARTSLGEVGWSAGRNSVPACGVDLALRAGRCTRTSQEAHGE